MPLAIEFDRSKNGIIKAAQNNIIAKKDRRHQSIQAGLADVDAGRIVIHSDMVDFYNRLKKTR